jgi:ADP-ribose pyrophosphatase
MKKITPAGPEKIVYQGKLFEVVEQPMNVDSKIKNFEYARRAPGTRIIIIKDNKILITKEHRHEHKDYDYRLPGGKVFDSLKEYNLAVSNKTDLIKSATIAAKKECYEEVGIIVNNLDLFKVTKAGATIKWDLYYFVTSDFKESAKGQNLDEGEVIKPHWFTFDKVKQLCIHGKMKEYRSVGVLLSFLDKNI